MPTSVLQTYVYCGDPSFWALSAFWEPFETNSSNWSTSLLAVGRKSTCFSPLLKNFWTSLGFRSCLQRLKIPNTLIHLYLSSNHEDWKSYLKYPDFLEEKRDCWIDAIERQEGAVNVNMGLYNVFAFVFWTIQILWSYILETLQKLVRHFSF